MHWQRHLSQPVGREGDAPWTRPISPYGWEMALIRELRAVHHKEPCRTLQLAQPVAGQVQNVHRQSVEYVATIHDLVKLRLCFVVSFKSNFLQLLGSTNHQAEFRRIIKGQTSAWPVTRPEREGGWLSVQHLRA